MSFFRNEDRSLYEEIEPGSQKKKKLKKSTATVIFASSVSVVLLIIVISNSSGDTHIPIELLPNAAVVTNLHSSLPNETQIQIQSEPVVLEALEDIIIELDQGKVLGFRMTSRAGREFLAFRGIPYAKPPTGERRFQPPEEIGPWDGVLNVTAFRPVCIQRSGGKVSGDEDCLHVNVYTPKKFNDLKAVRQKYLPVMVYVHGGVAGGNSNRNTGEYFMDEDIVLVGFNYRVGVLGNLNTNDSQARGNQGLRDQIKALEWVKLNIRNFGGDRKKVTLFGNSYGSMSISTHLLSPMTKGLFHQVICQSGHAIFPDLIQRTPVRNAFELGEKLNCSATTTAELLTCFRNTDAETLIYYSHEVKVEDGNDLTYSKNVFTTSIDPVLEDVNENDVYLPESPIKLLEGGKTKRMPAIIGVNNGEGLGQSVIILALNQLTKIANEQWETVMPGALSLPDQNSTFAKDFVVDARDFYIGSKNISQETLVNFTNLFSDRLGIHPAHVSAFYQKQTNSNRENVYLYYLTKKVERSYLGAMGDFLGGDVIGELGPAHADEIQFLFPYDPFPKIPMGSANANFSRMMVHLWASFAANGKPDLADNGAEWVPIMNKPFDWFQLDNEPKMINHLGERMDFWDSYNLTDLYI